MKRNMKKVVAMLMSTVMVGSLAACGGEKTNKTETTTTADGKTVINIVKCTNNLASVDSEEVKNVETAINEYIADKLDVKINLTEYVIGEYSDKCNMSLAGNEINMLWTASWLGAINCDNLFQSEAVYDITDMIQGTELYNTMPENVWNASKYDGKNYFIPVYKEVAEGYDIMFRKDLVDKYKWDLSTVKELKDIEPMLEDLKDDENVDAPLLIQSTYLSKKFLIDDFDFLGGTGLFGVDRKTNEVVSVINTELYKEHCKLISDWAEKGYILEGDATKSNPSAPLTTKYWGISWWTDVPNNLEANTRYKQDVEMVHLTDNWISSNTALGSCYAISATSTEEQAQACIDFVELLYTDKELADLYTFGIEGVDYDRDENGYIVKKGDLYNHSSWESCNVRCVSLEQGEPENKVELFETFNAAGKESVASGFRLDKEPIEAQLAACQNVQETFGFALENGGYAVADVEAVLASFQKALDEAGFQDVLKEVSRQYEEWKAAK